ncbi:MAG: LysE family transporter [Candidatus Pacebacteria bacterium]|nr:LysE family transporter [Candidatus Paceibacterota bacterium]
MEIIFNFLFLGIFFGLISGLSPGPLLTMVIVETLRHSKKEGIKIAIAPLITDIPIVGLTLFVLSKLLYFDHVMGYISFSGAIFLGYLAYDSFKTKGTKIDLKTIETQSLKKGVVANFLSPHPYVFWLIIGAPILLQAYSINILSAILFVIGFYFCLIGSKITIALLTEKSKTVLNSKSYLYVMNILAVLLLFYSIVLIKNGLDFFGFF